MIEITIQDPSTGDTDNMVIPSTWLQKVQRWAMRFGLMITVVA